MFSVKPVYLVTGSLPPAVCGVGDYTGNLFNSLRTSKKYCISVIFRPNWSFKRLIRDILSQYPVNSIFHLQYPTEGFGYSLSPLFFFLALRSKKILTLHEFSSKSLLGRLYIIALCFTVDHIIVSSEAERDSLTRSLANFRIKRPFFIFPIPSNIPRHAVQLSFKNRPVDLAYFGQIRPGKGFESFIDLCASLPASNEYSVSIIGSVPEGYSKYASNLFESGVLKSVHNLKISLSEPPSAVSSLLSNIKCLYLPFPDGFSLKRGSLLAGAINGCQIITTYPTTLVDFRLLSCLHLVESNDQALTSLISLVEGRLPIKDTSPLVLNRTFEKCSHLHQSLYSSL